ncbi:MAG: carboxypeptidase-like regulatory domain-containing protein [Gemmatimonadetes bacterium]|nr:carboxypeptidase-like regulatory domain-containing protein [Gemmatimonadota bacterium]
MRVGIAITIQVVLVMVGAGTVFAQSASATGRVTDAISGEAIPGVVITIAGTRHSARTTETGEYRFERLRSGELMVRLRAPGYT